MSELPKRLPETSETHHEQVLALLGMLDLTGRENESASCIFDKEDFGGRLLLNGYERVTVEVNGDTVGVRLVHPPFDDKQGIEAYSYSLDDRSLTVQQTTRDYDDRFEDWAREYDEINDKLEERQDAATSAYHAVMTTIRNYGRSDMQVAAAFDYYDRESERIMAVRDETGQTDELEYLHLENEAKMLDLFEMVAGDIPGRTQMLQKYREALLTIQVLKSKLDTLSGQLDSIQILTVVQPADPAEFTRALETIGGLIQDKN